MAIIARREISYLGNRGPKATFIDGQALQGCSPIPDIRANRSIFSSQMMALRILKPVDDQEVWAVSRFYFDKSFRRRAAVSCFLAC